jgi:ABC-2 type transport system permease protein
MRKILYIVQKEFRQIRRTRAYFALIFVAPFGMLLVMGSALTTEVTHVPVAVLDQDHSPSSRAILDTVLSTDTFHFVGAALSEAQATTLLDDGRAKMVVVIPPHFERELKDGSVPQVQLLVDGVDGNSAGVAVGYAAAMLGQLQLRWARELAPHLLAPTPSLSGDPAAAGGPGAAGLALPFAVASKPPHRLTVVPRMWYNPNLDSKPNFVPGLIGILLVMITTLVMAVNIVREKEIGTLEQLLVTPLRGVQIIVGKLIPFAILGFAQLTVGVVAAGLVFGIWMKGSFLALYAMAGVFFLSTLGLGLFVSTLARTQQQAMFVAWFFMIFTILLSGFFVPIENMPPFIQAVTYINPLRYFILILREIYLKGTGLRDLWREALALAAIGSAALVFASIRFQKRLK